MTSTQEQDSSQVDNYHQDTGVHDQPHQNEDQSIVVVTKSSTNDGKTTVSLKVIVGLIITLLVFTVATACLVTTVTVFYQSVRHTGEAWARQLSQSAATKVYDFYYNKEYQVLTSTHYARANNLMLPKDMWKFQSRNWTDFWLPYIMQKASIFHPLAQAFSATFFDGFWMFSSTSFFSFKFANNKPDLKTLEWVEAFNMSAPTVGGIRYFINNMTPFPYGAETKYNNEIWLSNRPPARPKDVGLANLVAANAPSKQQPGCVLLGPFMTDIPSINAHWQQYLVCEIKNHSDDAIGMATFGIETTSAFTDLLRYAPRSPNGQIFIFDKNGYIYATTYPVRWWTSVKDPNITWATKVPTGCSHTLLLVPTLPIPKMGCFLNTTTYPFAPLHHLSKAFVAARTPQFAWVEVGQHDSSGGSGMKYAVASEHVLTPYSKAHFNVVVIIPESDLTLNDRVGNSFKLAIGLSVLVLVVVLLTGLNIVHVILGRLERIQKKMQEAANLKFDEDDDGEAQEHFTSSSINSPEIGVDAEKERMMMTTASDNEQDTSDGEEKDNIIEVTALEQTDGEATNANVNSLFISMADRQGNHERRERTEATTLEKEFSRHGLVPTDNNNNNHGDQDSLPHQQVRQESEPQQSLAFGEEKTKPLDAQATKTSRSVKRSGAAVTARSTTTSADNYWISEIAAIEQAYGEVVTAMTNLTRYVPKPIVSDLIIQRKITNAADKLSHMMTNSPAAINNTYMRVFDDVSVLFTEIEGFTSIWQWFSNCQRSATFQQPPSRRAPSAAVAAAISAAVSSSSSSPFRTVNAGVMRGQGSHEKHDDDNDDDDNNEASTSPPRRSFCGVGCGDWNRVTLAHSLITSILHIYFKRMCRLIMGHGGIVDKFLGDAIMSYWGAPTPTKYHALLAALCSLALQRESRRDPLRRLFRNTVRRDLVVNCGIGTGRALVGPAGNNDTIVFTVIGEPVSVARGLVESCRRWKVNVMCDEKTIRACHEALYFRLLALQRLNDKKVPTLCYEIVALDLDSKILYDKVLSKLPDPSQVVSSLFANDDDHSSSVEQRSKAKSAVSGPWKQQQQQRVVDSGDIETTMATMTTATLDRERGGQQVAENEPLPVEGPARVSGEPKKRKVIFANGDAGKQQGLRHEGSHNHQNNSNTRNSFCKSDVAETIPLSDLLSVATLNSKVQSEYLRLVKPAQTLADAEKLAEDLLRWHVARTSLKPVFSAILSGAAESLVASSSKNHSVGNSMNDASAVTNHQRGTATAAASSTATATANTADSNESVQNMVQNRSSINTATTLASPLLSSDDLNRRQLQQENEREYQHLVATVTTFCETYSDAVRDCIDCKFDSCLEKLEKILDVPQDGEEYKRGHQHQHLEKHSSLKSKAFSQQHDEVTTPEATALTAMCLKPDDNHEEVEDGGCIAHTDFIDRNQSTAARGNPAMISETGSLFAAKSNAAANSSSSVRFSTSNKSNNIVASPSNVRKLLQGHPSLALLSEVASVHAGSERGTQNPRSVDGQGRLMMNVHLPKSVRIALQSGGLVSHSSTAKQQQQQRIKDEERDEEQDERC